MAIQIGQSSTKKATKKSALGKKPKKSKAERLKEAYDKAKRGAGGGDFHKFVNGVTRIVVLPAIDDDDLFFAEGGQHYKATPDGKPVGCPNATTGKPCPICDVLDEARSIDKEHKLLKNSRLNRRYYYNILVLPKSAGFSGDEPELRLMSIASGLHLQILDLEQDTEDYGDISNPNDALIIRVKRTGEKWNDVEYNATPASSRIDLEEQYPELFEEWMEKRKDLEQLTASFIPDKDKLEAIAERMEEEL